MSDPSRWKLIVFPLIGLGLGYVVLVATTLFVLVVMPPDWSTAARNLLIDREALGRVLEVTPSQRLFLLVVSSVPPLCAAAFYVIGYRLALQSFRPSRVEPVVLTRWMIEDLRELPPGAPHDGDKAE